jgi:hypothetical protein
MSHFRPLLRRRIAELVRAEFPDFEYGSLALVLGPGKTGFHNLEITPPGPCPSALAPESACTSDPADPEATAR